MDIGHLARVFGANVEGAFTHPGDSVLSPQDWLNALYHPWGSIQQASNSPYAMMIPGGKLAGETTTLGRVVGETSTLGPRTVATNPATGWAAAQKVLAANRSLPATAEGWARAHMAARAAARAGQTPYSRAIPGSGPLWSSSGLGLTPPNPANAPMFRPSTWGRIWGR